MSFGTQQSLFDAARAQADQIKQTVDDAKELSTEKGDLLLGTLPVSAELAKYIGSKTGINDALNKAAGDAFERLKSTLRGPSQQPSEPPETSEAQRAQQLLGSDDDSVPTEEMELDSLNGLRGSAPNELGIQGGMDNPLYTGDIAGDVAGDTAGTAAGTTAGDTATTVATDVGIDAGVAADEAVGGALDATGVLAPIGAAIGILGALGGIGAQLGEGLKDLFDKPRPILESYAQFNPSSIVSG